MSSGCLSPCMAVHAAQLVTSSSVPSLGWKIQITVKYFYLTIQNNGGTSVAVGKHRHHCTRCQPWRDFHWLGKLGSVFSNGALVVDISGIGRGIQSKWEVHLPVLSLCSETRADSTWGNGRLCDCRCARCEREAKIKHRACVDVWIRRNSHLDWGLPSCLIGKQVGGT